MEKSNKRGKIPQQDWPSIMARYDAGETLASIARTYDCSPPAISYIVSRSRARNAETDSAPPPVTNEPQLVKSHTADPAATSESPNVLDPAPVGAASAMPAPAENGSYGRHSGMPDSRADARPYEGNGVGRFTMAARDVNRAGPLYNGSAGRLPEAPPIPAAPRGMLHLSGGSAERVSAERLPAGPAPAPRPNPERPGPERFGLEHGREPVRPEHDSVKAKDTYIDEALRARVDGDIAAFLAAFDAALAADSLESRAGLREATDRLLRAGARTRIELERLEARVPLPPRDNTPHHGGAWRHR